MACSSTRVRHTASGVRKGPCAVVHYRDTRGVQVTPAEIRTGGRLMSFFRDQWYRLLALLAGSAAGVIVTTAVAKAESAWPS